MLLTTFVLATSVLTMNAETIVDMLDREPFQPFRVCLSSGEHYDVLNPHMVAVMKSKVFIALPDSERSTFVSYLHIAALETISNGNGRNGKPRRRRK
jgi:hypothetical protein